LQGKRGIKKHYMSKTNKNEQISKDFIRLTKENQDYALAIVQAMVYAQNSGRKRKKKTISNKPKS